MQTVLVTGISGFLGGHVALRLLASGYAVRGSLRDPGRAEGVRAMLARAGADISRLEIVPLDLLDGAGWQAAADGCAFLQHVASPLVLRMPRDPEDLIRPAVDGTRRALAAGLAAGMERMVVTSSVAAILYGHADYARVFTEADWTLLDGPNIAAYTASKTLAERAAWQMAEEAGARQRLAVINPGVILGPLLDRDPGLSATLVIRMLRGRIPVAPNLLLGYADVRDVAAAQVAAMENPAAGGNRHIVSSDILSLMQVAAILREAFPDHAGRLPRFELPNWAARLAARLLPAMRGAATELGTRRQTDPAAVERLLGRPLRPAREAVIATGRAAIDLGLV